MRPFAFLTAAALFAASQLAFADVVRPPPRNCPAGSHGETGHAGPYCTPTPCTTDAECVNAGRGLICTDAPLCVQEVTYTDWSGQQYTRKEVTGPCDANGGCPPPAMCDTSTKCAPPSGTSSSTGPSGSTGSGAASSAQSGAGGAATGGAGSAGEEERRIDGCDCTVPAGHAPSGSLLAMAALALAAAARRTRSRLADRRDVSRRSGGGCRAACSPTVTRPGS